MPAGVAAMHALLAVDRADEARAALASAPRAALSLDPLLTDEAHRLVHGMLALADHATAASPEVWAGIFDKAAALSPVGSVALYSLGDEARLADATREVVDWLRAERLLDGRPQVLEIGCGIGRFLTALRDEVSLAVGLDVSSAMCAEAERRTRIHPGVGVVRTNGRDLRAFGDGSFDLVLAVDSFPYLVSAGVQFSTLAEAARVLRPDGSVVVLNWSYRGDPTEDRDEAAEAAASAGLALQEGAAPAMEHWDGAVFRFRRNAC